MAVLSAVVVAACGERKADPKQPDPPAATTAAPVPEAVAPTSDAPAPSALRAQALAAYNAKSYADCERLFAAAASGTPGAAGIDDAYSAACCAALGGRTDDAYLYLRDALDRGYRDAPYLDVDADLASLREDERWKDIVAGAAANHDEYMRGSNAELARIHEEDQADRRPGPDGIDWSMVAPRDAARRARVREMLAAKEVRTAVDYFHAAMVFQHGEPPDDYALARELALEAVKLDPTNDRAKWLAAAAEDRHLMNQGKPQRYGTQFHKVDGRWALYDVDPSVTDEERAKWNVPPLAVARQRADQMNGK